MGMLVDGEWTEGSIIKSDTTGAYDRLPRTFRDFISSDHPTYKPQSERYHLYVSYACPWACRTLMYRELKELKSHVTVSVVHPDMLTRGWVFDASFRGATVDHLFNYHHLHQVYTKADSKVTTSVTVPVLWDKITNTIVNNESSEIIRMFNSSFNDLTGNHDDYYPVHLRAEVDTLNAEIYDHVNNGVYKCGFAKTQEAYDQAVTSLFATLDRLETRLASRRFLTGDQLTEADLRLIPTLLRFDIVYVTHFKCNIRRIRDYPHLGRYTRELYDMSCVRNTTDFDHIKRHYYYSHPEINPCRIIPKGPIDIF